MKTRLFDLYDSVRTSFWFVPVLLVVFFSAVAFALVELEDFLPGNLDKFTYIGGGEGARLLLTTIAGSMITIAGVVFSIAMVTLTLTTTQFGPRLLRNFMKDKGNQVVLGMFVATFIYCLLVLKAVRTVDDMVHIPRLAVSFSLILAIGDVGILIYFLHHVSTSIHADQVIDKVYGELVETMNRLFKGASYPGPEKNVEHLPADFQDNCETVCSGSSGYLKAIDTESILTIAVKKNLIIQIKCRPGDYIFKGIPLAQFGPKDKIDDYFKNSMINAFLLGPKRAPEQDIEFAIQQLVEIALRALSPGINDPFTALSCIDRLGDIIRQLNCRQFPLSHRYDKDGHLRLIMDVFNYQGIMDAAFNQIRQIANIAVNMRLLEILKEIAQTAANADQKAAVRRHAEMLLRSAKESIHEEEDLKDINSRFEAIMKLVNTQNK